MLYWDHMPLTGTLFQHSVAVDTFECPGERERQEESEEYGDELFLLVRRGEQCVALSIRAERTSVYNH